jgi:hypothetical protein
MRIGEIDRGNLADTLTASDKFGAESAADLYWIAFSVFNNDSASDPGIGVEFQEALERAG